MAAFNYADLAATAERLLAKFGRDVVFQRTSRAPADSQKPWRGPATGDVTSVAARAVVVGERLEGDPRRPAYDQVLVAGSAGIEGFDMMVDGGVVRQVESIEVLRPGDETVLYIARVRR